MSDPWAGRSALEVPLWVRHRAHCRRGAGAPDWARPPSLPLRYSRSKRRGEGGGGGGWGAVFGRGGRGSPNFRFPPGGGKGLGQNPNPLLGGGAAPRANPMARGGGV